MVVYVHIINVKKENKNCIHVIIVTPLEIRVHVCAITILFDVFIHVFLSVCMCIYTPAGTCIPQGTCKSQTRILGIILTFFHLVWNRIPLLLSKPDYLVYKLLEILVSPFLISLYGGTGITDAYATTMLCPCTLSNKIANMVTCQIMLPSLSEKWPQGSLQRYN